MLHKDCNMINHRSLLLKSKKKHSNLLSYLEFRDGNIKSKSMKQVLTVNIIIPLTKLFNF